MTSPDADRFRAATAFGLPGKAASMDEVDAGMFLDGHSKVGGDRERLAGDTTYIARAASEPERLPSVVLNGLRANGEPKQPATTPTTLLSRMTVVRTAEITVHVTDLQKKYDELSKMVKAYRGFLADTEITTDDEGYRNGTIEVRVPPESFEDAVERIHQFGKVIASKVGADDVTGEYMQLEEQLPRLREREAELRQAVEKLKPSKDYSAKFLARERLAEVQSRIEQETFRLKFLKDQVKLSTISATLTERPANLATASARGDWSLAETAGTAWAQSLVLLRLLVTALIWVGVYFSVYLVLGMAIWYGAKKLLSLRQTPTQP